LNAIDYVVKPIAIARLNKTVTRIRGDFAAGRPSATDFVREQRNKLKAELEKGAGAGKFLKHIQVTVGKQLRFIMVEEILYFQADNKYTRVATAQQDALIRVPLSELLESLDGDQFWRIHRSTVVNIRAIDNVTRIGLERMTVQIRGRKEALEVSRIHQSQFRGM
jgi:DNA-binding LytR/AlgR family response regulator